MQENRCSEFPTRSDISQTVQSQKIVKSLKLQIEEEGTKPIKGADQLC